MSAREIITEIVSIGVTPVSRAAGFKKSGLNLHRRRGGVVHVINFQLSHGNFADAGRFYINVGIAFDVLWRLDGKAIPDRPKEYECHFRRRLEQLISEAPAATPVTSTTDIEETAAELQSHFRRLMMLLDPVDSPQSFLERGWLQVGTDLELRARLNYVAGRYRDAWDDVNRAADFFSDRQGCSTEELIVRLNLNDLALLKRG